MYIQYIYILLYLYTVGYIYIQSYCIYINIYNCAQLYERDNWVPFQHRQMVGLTFEGSVPDQTNTMTYKSDTCHFLYLH